MPTPSPEHQLSADDTVAKPAESAAVEVTPVPADSPGTMLRAARERAGMSLGDVATRLRMGVRQVDALERGDYGALPTGTFLRGFVRNYAKAVNADGEQAIRLLEHSNAEAARLKAAPVVVPSHDIHIRSGGSGLVMPKARIAIFAGVALLLAGAVWYWSEYVRPNLANGGQPSPVAVPETARPISVPAIPIDNGPPGEVESPADGKATPARGGIDKVPTVNSSAVVAPAEANTAAKPVAASPLRVSAEGVISTSQDHILGFTFSGESWVEVTDAKGRTVLSRHYHAGETGEVSGIGPLSVVIGNAQVTRMADNGKEIELAPHTRVSVARMTVK